MFQAIIIVFCNDILLFLLFILFCVYAFNRNAIYIMWNEIKIIQIMENASLQPTEILVLSERL